MKTLLLNDTHIGFRRSNPVFNEHIMTLLERVVDYCIENNIKRIAHLGDLFDTRTHINMITLNSLKERFFLRLQEADIDVDIIPGNHDLSYRHSIESNSVDLLLREFPNIVVYNKPTVIKLPDATSYLMVPWLGKENEKEFLNEIDLLSCETDICLGHFEFSGFLYQAGVIASSGMESSIFIPKFKHIFSGHYHSKSTSGNIHYLGAQYDLTWGDYDEKKYFHVLETSTGEIEAIENPNKMFHKIFYDETFVNDEFFAELSKMDYNNKIVKIIVLNRRNMIMFDSFMEKLYKHNPYEVSVVDESITKAKEEIKVDTTILTKSTLEIIDTLVKDTNLDGYDSDLVQKLFHEFYELAEEE